MTELEDIDALAGEYVLGTLDPAERAAVAARRLRERDLEEAILAWEGRLGPLSDGFTPIVPPPELAGRIVARISAGTQTAGGAGVVTLERRLKTWRGLAIAATGLAACLMVTLGIREYTRTAPGSYVAVFVQDDVAPSFLLSVDFDTKTLTVKPVAAKPQTDKSYQLWIVHEKLGGVPQSLGLIEIDSSGASRRSVPFDRALLTTATFGVSVEPPGGSPAGRPTGPALHAKLFQSTL